MKDEAINKFISEMTDILKSAKDFTLEQAPDILRQVLAWKVAENILDLITGIVAAIAAVVLWRWVSRTVQGKVDAGNAKKNGWRYSWGDYPEYLVPGGMISLILALIGVCGTYGSASDLLKIHFAPKVYLIEYFAKLARK